MVDPETENSRHDVGCDVIFKKSRAKKGRFHGGTPSNSRRSLFRKGKSDVWCTGREGIKGSLYTFL
jgi:hypothetical protein